MLEQVVKLCTEVTARGYDSIQLLDESYHSDAHEGSQETAHQYEHEFISCHSGCTSMSTGTLASACLDRSSGIAPPTCGRGCLGARR